MGFRRSPATTLAALTGLNLLNYIDRFVVAAVLPLILAEFKITDAQGGMLHSLFMVTYLVVSPVAGWLADVRPRLKLAALGVLTWSAATFASGLAPTFAILLIARAMSGIGEATYAVVTPSLLADSFTPEKRARVLAVFFAALPIGSALAYGIGGWLGETRGWRPAFLVVGGPAVFLCLVLFILVEPTRGAFEAGAAQERTSAGLVTSLRALRRRSSYIYNTVAQMIFTFSLMGMAVWVPTFLVRERALPLKVANFRFGVVLVVAGLVGTLVGGHVGDRLARRYPSAHFTFSALATIIAVPFIVAAITTHNQLVLWPCTFVGLLLLFFITGPLQAAMVNVLPADLRGRGVAVYTVAIHLLGDVLSPTLIGLASDRIGNLEAPMVATILLLGVSGLVLLVGRRALVRDLAAMS
jgi:MFS transporter, Spinster family, sphingosine-1-phosphate transporter